MTSAYLTYQRVLEEMTVIDGLVERNREARRRGHASALDRFFWLSAQRKQDGIRFHPSCTPGNAQDKRHWICNLVLRGGGTLGLAHIGFVAGLERAGIRFAGLAGASAGSIVAMGIAAARGNDLLHSVTDQISRSTSTAPLDGFIDGPRPIRKLIKHLLLRRPFHAPPFWLGLIPAWRRLLRRRGLNQGDNFERWYEAEMARFGVPRLADLERNLATIHDTLDGARTDLKRYYSECLDDGRQILVATGPKATTHSDKAARIFKLISSAMPIGMKFELPKDLVYLHLQREQISPAKLVRMSMAIPAFFEPVRIPVNRAKWSQAPLLNHLKDLVSNSDVASRFDRLDELTFIDGGVFSNMPSDSFETDLPDLPTILVPLVSDSDAQRFKRDNRTSSLVKDALACVQAMRFQRDTDTYLRLQQKRAHFDTGNTAGPYPRSYNIATAPIPTGDMNWLNFVMHESDKRQLVLNGVTAARIFLEGLENGKQ